MLWFKVKVDQWIFIGHRIHSFSQSDSIQNAVWQWVSTRTFRAPWKEQGTVIFLVITAAESLCTNSYIYEKMKKQNLSEWMEIFKFPHDVRKYEVHGLRKCFVGIKPWVILSINLHSWSLLLQLLLNYFKFALIFRTKLAVGYIRWSRTLSVCIKDAATLSFFLWQLLALF